MLLVLSVMSLSLMQQSVFASGPLDILTVGADQGGQATEIHVPTVPSALGGVDHWGSVVMHVDELTFNTLTAADLAAYDVVLTQWNSSGDTDLSSLAVQDYVNNGGGLLVDGDFRNYNDLDWVGVFGAADFCDNFSFTCTASADPVLTDALPASPDLVNCHGIFPNYDAMVFVVALVNNNNANAMLAGKYGAGRIILTGPDNDDHSFFDGSDDHYQSLLNQLEWITLANDVDDDGVLDDVDNCPNTPNSAQTDTDADGEGDACDSDDDDDGVEDILDNCQFVANADQDDFDADGEGDACDTDVDGDNVNDSFDACMSTPLGALVDATGCSIAQLCPCDNDWKNHGAFVKCTSHAASDFRDAGLIFDSERGLIVSEAAQSTCGKK